MGMVKRMSKIYIGSRTWMEYMPDNDLYDHVDNELSDYFRPAVVDTSGFITSEDEDV